MQLTVAYEVPEYFALVASVSCMCPIHMFDLFGAAVADPLIDRPDHDALGTETICGRLAS